jgi:glycosyltransferase involved in cell wall biosynthesis
MTVLFLDQFSELGGAQLCLLDLLRGVRSRGWNASVAVPGNGALRRRIEELGIPVHSLDLSAYSLGQKRPRDVARFLCDQPKLIFAIRRLVTSTAASVVYVNGPRVLPAVSAAHTAVPVLFHSHNRISPGAGRMLVQLGIRATRATVAAASRFAAAQWGQAHVVYGGVEGPATILPTPARARPRVGMIGRFTPQKRQLEFCTAAAELARRGADIEFVLCGDAVFGDPASHAYKEEVLRTSPSSLHYIGWSDSIYEVLREIDLLVMPSTDEGGISRVVLEAFAAGVPVMACGTGAVAEAIEDGVTGFLLRSPEPADIAYGVRELLGNRDRMAAVAKDARELWRKRFTAERFRSEMLEVIERTANGTMQVTGRQPKRAAAGRRN